MEKKEEKQIEESKKENENKENQEKNKIKENKEGTDSKELKENKEGEGKKEERITKENKDLLIKIINDMIKKRLDELEKRNNGEEKTIKILKTNEDKIKSIYFFL